MVSGAALSSSHGITNMCSRACLRPDCDIVLMHTPFSPRTPFALVRRVVRGDAGFLTNALAKWKIWIPPKLNQGLQQVCAEESSTSVTIVCLLSNFSVNGVSCLSFQ